LIASQNKSACDVLEKGLPQPIRLQLDRIREFPVWVGIPIHPDPRFALGLAGEAMLNSTLLHQRQAIGHTRRR